MSRRSRRPPDIGRIREALKGPGADTKRFSFFVRVDDDQDAIDLDPTGVYLDCTHVETGEPVRILWGLRLLPGGGGIWTPPPAPGTELLAVFHEGDPSIGAADCMFCGPGQKLPASVIAEPNAVHIIGATERVILSSDASIAQKAPLVELGAENLLPIDGLVHGTGIDPFTGLTQFALGNTSGVVRGKK